MKKGHKHLRKRIMSTALAFALVFAMTMSNVPTGLTVGIVNTVQAATKKDKKKPVIKMKGKAKITVTKGTSVKIPKVTAKDNKDGNVTKKIKVTVKKGKKSYSAIAKKVKNNKAVKFTATGKYTITYTVKDKAGNKATKKRYVTVKNQSKKATTEQPGAEDIIMPSLSEYGTLKQIVVDGIDYYFLDDKTEQYSKIEGQYLGDLKYDSLKFEKWELATLVFDKTKKDYGVDQQYLSFIGKINVLDEYGVDCSNRIVVSEREDVGSKNVYVNYVDSKGEIICISCFVMFDDTYVHDEGILKDAEWDYIDDVNKIYIIGIKESTYK